MQALYFTLVRRSLRRLACVGLGGGTSGVTVEGMAAICAVESGAGTPNGAGPVGGSSANRISATGEAVFRSADSIGGKTAGDAGSAGGIANFHTVERLHREQ